MSKVNEKGFEKTRDDLQKSLDASKEEYRKCCNFFNEYQDERSSMIPGAPRPQDRERQLTSEMSDAP